MAPITTLAVAQDDANAVVKIDMVEARRIRDFLWIPLLAKDPSSPLRIEFSECAITKEGALTLFILIASVADRVVEVTLKGEQHKLLLGLCSKNLRNAPLEEVNVSDISLGDNGMMGRLEPLISKASIRRLFLNNCQLNDESIGTVYHSLPVESKRLMSHLHLGNNPGIGDKGGKNVGSLIAECPNLKHIDCSNCNIGVVGSSKLAMGLMHIVDSNSEYDQECTLRHINMAGCTFTSEKRAYDKLCAALGSLHHLVYVNISECHIHASGVEKLTRVLKRENKKLEMLFTAQDLVSDVHETVVEDYSQFPTVGTAALQLR